ncbi:hypothetical protein J6TS2_31180 [Heyndrickxia sporothermodurans]|nr:hypothetical protein J6TS2_31180 [Heyndrickxia sporothermodurans]
MLKKCLCFSYLMGFATQIERVIPDSLMNSLIVKMTSTGGIMIMAIGFNIVGILAAALIVILIYY